MGSYKEYRNARLAADPELKAEYDALEPEYEQAQEELQAYKKGLAWARKKDSLQGRFRGSICGKVHPEFCGRRGTAMLCDQILQIQ